LRFLESNGPSSIFSNDSYEQVLFNALYRMLKRLKHFAEPAVLNKNVEKIVVWFENRMDRFKQGETTNLQDDSKETPLLDSGNSKTLSIHRSLTSLPKDMRFSSSTSRLSTPQDETVRNSLTHSQHVKEVMRQLNLPGSDKKKPLP
jgi:hypothetical protein